MTATIHRPGRARVGRQFRTYPVKIKALAEGEDGQRSFEALVSVFGNIDAYGDRMMAGAFADTLAAWSASGDPIPVIWSHRWDDPKFNIGAVVEAEERQEGLWVRGQLDADHDTATTVYRLLKGRRVKEFSFAFDYQDIEQAMDDDGEPESDEWGWPVWNVLKVKLYEVGPCLVGANDQTQLYEVRSRAGRNGHHQRAAIASHSTATSDSSWDGPANEANLSNDDGAEVYRGAYAWVDGEGDPDVKSSYKFIHHFVSSSGSPGAASTVACSAGIAVLNGGRGGANIPDSDRQGVYNHLARHLRDADMEPPELKTAGPRLRHGESDFPTVAEALESLEAVGVLMVEMADAVEHLVGGLRALLDVHSAPVQTEPEQPGLPAQPVVADTDGKAALRATRGPAAWMTAFEAAGRNGDTSHDADDRSGDR